MRSDYISYILGVTLFVVAAYALINRATLESYMGGLLIYSSVVFVLALFGTTSLIFGYSQRPKKQTSPFITSPPTVTSLIELTRVNGIGEKRAEQLKALGIATVADLSVASAAELAEKLQVSTKIINRWIENARNLLLEK